MVSSSEPACSLAEPVRRLGGPAGRSGPDLSEAGRPPAAEGLAGGGASEIGAARRQAWPDCEPCPQCCAARGHVGLEGDLDGGPENLRADEPGAAILAPAARSPNADRSEPVRRLRLILCVAIPHLQSRPALDRRPSLGRRRPVGFVLGCLPKANRACFQGPRGR